MFFHTSRHLSLDDVAFFTLYFKIAKPERAGNLPFSLNQIVSSQNTSL